MNTVNFRRPTISDANEIWNLVKNCPPLDLNSQYLYLVLCHHFSDTCIVAEVNSKIIGFVSSYIPPDKKDTLFVWQVAVRKENRGSKIASEMVSNLFYRIQEKGITKLEATVTPSNKASKSLFNSLKSQFNTKIVETPLFVKEYFGSDDHEQEDLVQIGPIIPRKPVEMKLQ